MAAHSGAAADQQCEARRHVVARPTHPTTALLGVSALTLPRCTQPASLSSEHLRATAVSIAQSTVAANSGAAADQQCTARRHIMPRPTHPTTALIGVSRVDPPTLHTTRVFELRTSSCHCCIRRAGTVAASSGAQQSAVRGAAARRAEADSPNDRTQWSFRVDPPTLHTTRVIELRTSSCHRCPPHRAQWRRGGRRRGGSAVRSEAARRAEADSPNDRTQWSFRVDPPTLHTTRVFELRTSSCHCCIRRAEHSGGAQRRRGGSAVRSEAARRAEADSPNDRTQWSFRVDPPTLHTTRVFELRTSSCHCCIRRTGAWRRTAAPRRISSAQARRHVVPRPTHPTTALLGVSPALTLPPTRAQASDSTHVHNPRPRAPTPRCGRRGCPVAQKDTGPSWPCCHSLAGACFFEQLRIGNGRVVGR